MSTRRFTCCRWSGHVFVGAINVWPSASDVSYWSFIAPKSVQSNFWVYGPGTHFCHRLQCTCTVDLLIGYNHLCQYMSNNSVYVIIWCDLVFFSFFGSRHILFALCGWWARTLVFQTFLLYTAIVSKNRMLCVSCPCCKVAQDVVVGFVLVYDEWVGRTVFLWKGPRLWVIILLYTSNKAWIALESDVAERGSLSMSTQLPGWNMVVIHIWRL